MTAPPLEVGNVAMLLDEDDSSDDDATSLPSLAVAAKRVAGGAGVLVPEQDPASSHNPCDGVQQQDQPLASEPAASVAMDSEMKSVDTDPNQMVSLVDTLQSLTDPIASASSNNTVTSLLSNSASPVKHRKLAKKTITTGTLP